MSGHFAIKFLTADGGATHAHGFQWPLPEGRKFGAWAPKIEGDLVACENGYHVCEKNAGIFEWLDARAFLCEWRGDFIWKDPKSVRVVREARLVRELAWTDRTQRLFAADCAERSLAAFEKFSPDDSRIRNCIEIARKVARGELPITDLSAARSAAESAAWSAARSAAWSAAESAERKWQMRRLFQYLNGERK